MEAGMGELIGFSCRSILASAVTAMDGTELGFENVASGNSFKMRLSFSIPSTHDAAVMEDITVLGEIATAEHDAEESACAAAVRILWQDYNRIVLDFSLVRVWFCKERYSGLSEKVQHSKSALEDVLSQAVAVVNSMPSASNFFAEKVTEMRDAGIADTIVGSVTSCIAFLQMMYVRGMTVHQQGINQLGAMNIHGNLDDLLHAEGFVFPDNDDGSFNATGGLQMMLNRVADILDYSQPSLRIQTRGERHKAFFDFSPAAGSARRKFTSAGRVSFSIGGAMETAIFSALHALCLNHNREIGDLNREAYLFARERVTELGSELESLGNVGTSVCSYFSTTRRGLRMMLNSYAHLFRHHLSGEELVEKLQAITSEVEQCLDAIGGPVRVMNENAVVGLLPF